jgi:hypothetical protein
MAKKVSTRLQYKDWQRKQFRISNLFLDPANIRLEIDSTPNQQSLINDLFANENAMQVLESIANNGFFPDELLVVVEENGKYLAIDGNRRLAALKALAHPELVHSQEAKIRELAKIAGPLQTSIEVVAAPDRNSVRQFLASKHTQNTRRPWRPLRQAFFYRAEIDAGKTVEDLRKGYPGVDINKFLRLISVHRISKSLEYDSAQVAKKVHNERKFPATTLERLYEDKNVRNFLGFDFDGDGDVKIKIQRKEFEKGFRKIVQDVVNKSAAAFGRVDSRTLNSEKQRKDYLATFPKEDIPKKTIATVATTVKDFKEVPPKVGGLRRYLAPSDMPYHLKSSGVRRMLTELQTIDYRKFPNASHDLLRSFLECSLKAYFKDAGRPVKPQSHGGFVFLDRVLGEFINEMRATSNKGMEQVASRIRANQKMTSYSAYFLNATNHNPDVSPTPEEVRDAWDAMESLFRFVLWP